MSTPHRPYPSIQGLTWHRTRYYSFFTPMNWHRFEWPDGRDGQVYGPDPDDPHTIAGVSLDHLDTTLTTDDLETVAEGFFGTLEQLPAVSFELRDQSVKGRVLMLEARFTYADHDAVRKRWVRVIYHHTRQVTFIAQGATPEKFAYWLPMFFELMATANVHNEMPGLDFWG